MCSCSEDNKSLLINYASRSMMYLAVVAEEIKETLEQGDLATATLSLLETQKEMTAVSTILRYFADEKNMLHKVVDGFQSKARQGFLEANREFIELLEAEEVTS